MVCKLTIYNNDQCILLHSLSKEKRESILLHIVDEMQNYYAYYRIYSYGYLGLSVTWAYPIFGMTLNLSARCAINERGQCGFVNLTKLKKKDRISTNWFRSGSCPCYCLPETRRN